MVIKRRIAPARLRVPENQQGLHREYDWTRGVGLLFSGGRAVNQANRNATADRLSSPSGSTPVMIIATIDRDQRERTDGHLVGTTGVACDDAGHLPNGWTPTGPHGCQHGDMARMLSMLPAEGEVIKLDDSVRRKLAGLSRFFNGPNGTRSRNQGPRVPIARVTLYERTAILISRKQCSPGMRRSCRPWWPTKIGHEAWSPLSDDRSGDAA